MSSNVNLTVAKDLKNDEFYTRYADIEKELANYTQHFKNKVVYCNCDFPSLSSFWKYFHINFNSLGLRKLITTHYWDGMNPTYKTEYTGGDDGNIGKYRKIPLKGDGDFRSRECLDLLKESDIVVTNPPFSLAREYIISLVKNNVSFLCIGDLNWITYKEVFPLLRSNRIWLGNNSVKEFIQPDGSIKKFGNKLWFTNLDHNKRHVKLSLYKRYDAGEYPKYDNYNAVECGKVDNIPVDYREVMGVPITYLNKHNPEQFEIVGLANGNFKSNSSDELKKLVSYVDGFKDKGGCPLINGKLVYPRILIRRV